MSTAPKYFPDEKYLAEKAVKFVLRMETLAKQRPDGFRFRLALHIVLGYTFYLSAVLLTLLVSLMAIVAAIASRVFWLLGAALGSLASGIGLLQSLNVQLPAPKGMPIFLKDAPLLHETVHQLAAEAGAPKIDAILLIPEPNASISSQYTNGLFGRTTTTLRLGLPLLQLLSSTEFRALLHHEFAHSADGHGNFRIWTARVWESWSQLPLIDNELGFAARLLLPPVYRWFVPKLTAYSAVLSRVHEFAADHQALTHASDSRPDLMLMRVGLAGQFMEQRFWPKIWRDTRELPRTPSAVFSRLPEVASGVSSSDIRDWAKLELEKKSTPLESHPDLSARLRALGSTVDPEEWTRTIAELGFVPESAAASEYFGNSLPRYEKHLTEQWARGSFLIWEDAFHRSDRIQKRLAELRDLEKSTPLNAEQQIECAVCVWNLDGPADAEPLMRKAHADFPEDDGVRFSFGRCLLDQDKEEGILLMERVIGLASSSVRYEATVAICNFLERHNRNDEAVAFYNRMAREDEQKQKIALERNQILPAGPVSSHGLDQATIERIRSQVSTLNWVVTAYFCRKPTPLSPDRPLYLLALKPRRKFLIPAFRAGMTAFDQVAALNCYPVETRFLLLDGQQAALEKVIRRLPDSLLFKR